MEIGKPLLNTAAISVEVGPTYPLPENWLKRTPVPSAPIPPATGEHGPSYAVMTSVRFPCGIVKLSVTDELEAGKGAHVVVTGDPLAAVPG